ncbi:hypothetical protein [uncultured Roseibium sp.]|uniref:hypothetical protein n=1 Tax=uncultured Roseibium sp. TaxID=1936171 RepID=UPI00262C186B|nr:hypothetical protein [uncultured Roseibium sp.]
MRKQIDIEKLLKWAYCEELPKGGRDGGGTSVSSSNFLAILELILLGVQVDKSGGTPDHQLAGFFDEVHPDALKVHEAVCSFNELALDLPDDWCPMPELREFGEYGDAAIRAAVNSLTLIDADGERRLKQPLGLMLQSLAISGECPNGHGEAPVLRTVCGDNGGPIWFRLVKATYYDESNTRVTTQIEQDDGWDKYRRRPKRGAYQKKFLHPDPHQTLVARGKYQLWLAVLMELVEMLSERLTDFVPIASPRVAEPWNSAPVGQALRGRPIRIAGRKVLTAT